MKITMTNQLRWLAVALSIALFSSVTTNADDFNWDVAGPADWNDGDNWFNATTATPMAGPPSGGGGNHASISNGGTAEISADIPDIQDIFVGNGVGNSGTVNQTGGNTFQGSGSWMFVGRQGGTGVYNLSGGTQGKERLFIGIDGGSNGELNLSDTGHVGGQFLVVGDSGSTGVANITGGSVYATSEVWVGNGGSESSGEINQSAGVVEAETWIAIGRDSGTGVVNLSGTAVMRKVVIDDGDPMNYSNSERSFITLGGLGAGSGGTLNIQDEAVLESGTNLALSESPGRYGIVNQSGGSVTLHDNPGNTDGINDSLELDFQNEGLGEYHLSGGSLSAETIDATTGTFDMTGGVLSAMNFVGNLDQNGGSTSPGASPGTMTVTGNYSLNSGDLDMEIEGNVAGTGYDQLIVTGDVSLAGDLSLSGAYVPVLGDAFTLIDNQGANAISGMFTGISEGSIVSFNGIDLIASYLGGDGNDFVLSNVPEPATMALAGMCLLSLAVRRRR